jgi:hypothetical protein
MLTAPRRDCRLPSPSDPAWPEIAVIAAHRATDAGDAAKRRQALLDTDWGPAAIRQMLFEQWCRAPDPATAEWIWEAFERFTRRHPVIVDRRDSGR